MTLWCIGTVGHFLLTARWLKRAGATLTRDEWWFQTMVVGTGTLSIALHLIASTAGLSIPRVLLLLAAGHAVAALIRVTPPAKAGGLHDSAHTELHHSPHMEPHHAPHMEPPGFSRGGDVATRALEVAAMVTLTAVAMQWALISLVSDGVSGSDAAHYHVPNAVNMALGASPFDLPATSHLYPMASSTLAAWFILPVRTTLLMDLVMVLPFLLLIAAAGWLFRLLTSLSGLAWCTWLMLALFATPLFRLASLMSADLLFAAATMAFAATLLAPLIRRQLRTSDVWLIALSLGLLLGSKVTGIVVAALLGIPAVVALGVKGRSGFQDRRRAIGAAKATPYVPSGGRAWALARAAGATLAVLGAGGIWLVRNWLVWGSPVAPNGVALFGITLFPGVVFEATTYASVLGDITETAGYQLAERSNHFLSVWMSRWYLLGLGALALIPIDAIVSRRDLTRLWTMLVACVTGAVMVWFLIGAPWTSLEWTRGSSLRYALPWLALLPVVAWAGLFPSSLPWYQRTPPAAIGGLAVCVGGLLIFGSHHELDYPPLPTLAVVFAAFVIVGARYALQLVTPRWAWLIAIGVILRASMLFDVWTTQADAHAQEARTAAIATGPRTASEQLYDSAIAFEAKDGHSCDVSGRRFFVTSRFDEAGALQGPRLTNQVFYAARDVRVTSRVRPAMGPCDYLITHNAIMETEKGAALHAGLNTSGKLVVVGTSGDDVLLVHR